jgi:hypothetical protein
MISFTDLFDEFYPYLPGCTAEFFRTSALHVAREFCTFAPVFKDEIDPVDTVAGQATYDLEPSLAMAEIIKVVRLSVNGVLLYDEKAKTPQTWTESAFPSYPTPPFSIAGDQIVLIDDAKPTASQQEGLTGTALYRPTINASSLPDVFTDLHNKEALRSGVLARMLSMPSQQLSLIHI